MYAMPPSNGGAEEFKEGEICASTLLLKAVMHDSKFETSEFEAIEKSAEVTNLDVVDPHAANHVNRDTAGYIGAAEVVAKVREVADDGSLCATLVTSVKGGPVSTMVDYGNVDYTHDAADGKEKFPIVYMINCAFSTAADDKFAESLGTEDGCSLDTVFITSVTTGADCFDETMGCASAKQ